MDDKIKKLLKAVDKVIYEQSIMDYAPYGPGAYASVSWKLLDNLAAVRDEIKGD